MKLKKRSQVERKEKKVLVPSLSLVSTKLVGGGDCVESGSSRVDGVSIMLVQEGARSKEVKGEYLEQVVYLFICIVFGSTMAFRIAGRYTAVSSISVYKSSIFKTF